MSGNQVGLIRRGLSEIANNLVNKLHFSVFRNQQFLTYRKLSNESARSAMNV